MRINCIYLGMMKKVGDYICFKRLKIYKVVLRSI